MAAFIDGAICADVAAVIVGTTLADLPSGAFSAFSAFYAERAAFGAFIAILAIGRSIDPFPAIGAGVPRMGDRHCSRNHADKQHRYQQNADPFS